MFTFNLMNRAIRAVDCCPWGAAAGRLHESSPLRGRPLYTADQRLRRDASRWTLVQGILAPLQFAVFLVSVILVLRYLASGHGLEIATASIVVKTAVLYTIMITGATGALGRLTIDELLPLVPAGAIAALARDPSALADLAALGVDVRRGDGWSASRSRRWPGRPWRSSSPPGRTGRKVRTDWRIRTTTVR